MEAVFLKLLNLSITASWLVLAVVVLRLVLKKAPKWILCLLWGLVALRLICPVSLESVLSVIPEKGTGEQVVAEITQNYLEPPKILFEGDQFYHEAVEAGRAPVYSQDGYYVVTAQDSLEPPATVGNTVIPIVSWIWFAGMLCMLAYALGSYIRLRLKVATATRLHKNIKQSEVVDSPFVLGFFRPVIYLPYDLEESDMAYVIAHEQAHIRRRDHWWKPLGFLLLAVYWFNPVMWLAYILLCRDIEAACDEKVIANMDIDAMRGYSNALISCSVHRRSIAACPLAFGEIGVKERVKRVMNYKKPAFWILLVALVLSVAAAVCFLTNPKEEKTYFADQLLCVEIQDSNGSVLGEEARYCHFQIRTFEGVTLPGQVAVDFSIRQVKKDGVKIAFDSPLISDSGEVEEIWLTPGERIRLVTPTPGGCSVYTFSFIDETDGAQDVGAEDGYRLAPGAYIPVSCVYISPLSSYSATNLAEDFRYVVTEDSFITEVLYMETSSEAAVNWRWQTTEEAKKELAFMKDLPWASVLTQDNCLYQKVDAQHFLIQNGGDLYYVHRGSETKTDYEKIWSIYALIPEAALGQRVTISLAEAAEKTEEELADILTGISLVEIEAAWGAPDGELSGFYGMYYEKANTRIVLYALNGEIIDISVVQRETTNSTGSVSEVQSSYNAITPVGTVPEEFAHIVQKNVFMDTTAYGDRLLKRTYTEQGGMITMYDLQGNVLGSHACYEEGVYGGIPCATVTSDGGFLYVVCTGAYYDSLTGEWADEDDCYATIIKCDQNGTMQWKYTVYGVSELAWDICVETDEGYYFFGIHDVFKEGIVIGTMPPTDICMQKLDKAGTKISKKMIACNVYNALRSLEFENGNFVVYVNEWASFDEDLSSATFHKLIVDDKLNVIQNEIVDIIPPPGERLDGMPLALPKALENVDYGKLSTVIDYGEFYLLIMYGSAVTTIKDPSANSFDWEVTNQTVYAAYDKTGNLLWRTVVDSVPS